jgi:predicted transcriptional regulator
VSWIIDAKALNAQQKHIAQIEEQTNVFAAQVKAYDYFAQGRAIDSDNAQFLHDMKYGLKYAKYAMAKAKNLKQLVAELESSDNNAHNAYKTMFDTMCWISEMKEYEEHQQQIDQAKENIRLSLKAYEYVNKGKEKDKQDAKLLRDKSCNAINGSSYYIFGMPDDIKEIAMQCLDKTLSQQRIATMVKQFVQSRTGVPVFDSTKNIEQSVLQFDASDVVDDLTVQCIDKTLSRQNIKTKMHQLSHVRTK